VNDSILGDFMKKNYKYILPLLISFVPVAGWADPWAMSPSYKSIANKETIKNEPIGKGYVLSNLLKGKPLKVSLWIENEKKGQFEYFSKMVKRVYQDWFDNAVRAIEKSGREVEFQDILPYLSQELAIEVVRQEEAESADLKVLIHDSLKSMHQFLYKEDGEERDGFLGVYTHEKKRINIPKQSSLPKPKYILQHVVGYSLGFSGQGYCERSCGDEVYASDSVYNIMNDVPELTCDDADGLINMADLTLGLRRGGETGWKSLCKYSSQHYLAGMSVRTNRYRSSHVADDYLILEEYENGEKIDTLEFKFTKEKVDPFVFVDEEEVVKRDSGGYPVLVKGKNGELVYYIRMYERVEKIVTKNGEMLTYMHTYPVSGAQLGLIKKFPIDGKVGLLKGKMTFKGRPLTATYIYPDGEKRLTLEYYTKKGQVRSENTYAGHWHIHEKRYFDASDITRSEGPIEEKMKEKLIEQRLFEWGQKWPSHLDSALK